MARPYTYTHPFDGLTIAELQRELNTWKWDHEAGLCTYATFKNRRAKILARIKKLENQKTAA